MACQSLSSVVWGQKYWDTAWCHFPGELSTLWNNPCWGCSFWNKCHPHKKSKRKWTNTDRICSPELPWRQILSSVIWPFRGMFGYFPRASAESGGDGSISCEKGSQMQKRFFPEKGSWIHTTFHLSSPHRRVYALTYSARTVFVVQLLPCMPNCIFYFMNPFFVVFLKLFGHHWPESVTRSSWDCVQWTSRSSCTCYYSVCVSLYV